MDELRQAGLFEAATELPHGLVYLPEFITRAEEQALLAAIEPLAMAAQHAADPGASLFDHVSHPRRSDLKVWHFPFRPTANSDKCRFRDFESARKI